MIPKIIHYCNLGNRELTPLLRKCRDSWLRHCGEYQLMEWNENTFAPYAVPFFEEAMRRRRFAFASDYVRAFVLHKYGGIYLDTDVELRNTLDPFLAHRAFTGFEIVGYPFTAVWGSEQGHSLPERIVRHYQESDYSETTNTKIVSRVIVEEYGIDPYDDTFQLGTDGLAVYPSTTFCVDGAKAVAVHHFAGSWVDKREVPYKARVAAKYYGGELVRENALTAPEMYRYIVEHVGIGAYVSWLVRMTVRHYRRRFLSAITESMKRRK